MDFGGNFPFKRSYFWLIYIKRHSRRHFTRVFHDFNQIYFILVNLGSEVSIGFLFNL